MADLTLRLIADTSDAERKLSDVERDPGWAQRFMRCGNCGAPFERVCSYCGRGDELVPALLDGSYILSRTQVKELQQPLPEPTDGKPRHD